MSTIKTIQIAFNLDDPFQKKLYDHYKGQGRNASLYGKMLIQKDLEQKEKVESELTNFEPVQIKTEVEPIKIVIGDGLKLIK